MLAAHGHPSHSYRDAYQTGRCPNSPAGRRDPLDRVGANGLFLPTERERNSDTSAARAFKRASRPHRADAPAMRETRGAVAAAIAAVEQSVAEDPPGPDPDAEGQERSPPSGARRVGPPPPPPPLPPLACDMPSRPDGATPAPRLTRRRARITSSAVSAPPIVPESAANSLHEDDKADPTAVKDRRSRSSNSVSSSKSQDQVETSVKSDVLEPLDSSTALASPATRPTQNGSSTLSHPNHEKQKPQVSEQRNGALPVPRFVREVEVFNVEDGPSSEREAVEPPESAVPTEKPTTKTERTPEQSPTGSAHSSGLSTRDKASSPAKSLEQNSPESDAALSRRPKTLTTGPSRGDQIDSSSLAEIPLAGKASELPEEARKPNNQKQVPSSPEAEVILVEQPTNKSSEGFGVKEVDRLSPKGNRQRKEVLEPSVSGPDGSTSGPTGLRVSPEPVVQVSSPESAKNAVVTQEGRSDSSIVQDARKPAEDSERPSVLATLTQLEHPIPVGTIISCRMPGVGTEHYRCVVVETRGRLLAGKHEPDALHYYIHFVGADRRLDIWIAADDARPGESTGGHKRPLLPGCSETALSLGQNGKATLEGNGPGITTTSTNGTDAVSTTNSTPATPSTETGKITRRRRRLIQEMNPVSEKELGNEMVEKMEKAREEKTKVKNVSSIQFGSYEMDCWYFAPFPPTYVPSDKLYVCGYCLKYMKFRASFVKHKEMCDWLHPPGKEIYHDARENCGPNAVPIKVYEVDGMLNPLYGQNLCLLAKLFLDHKTLHYDVAPFLFYVLTEESPDRPGHFDVVGFFSKEKNVCNSEFNVACILTLPPYQKKGYGKFLISFSYELSRRENKTGTPERPLSDLGQVSYRSFWIRCILTAVKRSRHSISSATDMALITGIREADVVSTLKGLGMLTTWKGEHLITTTFKGVDDALKKSSAGKVSVVSELVRWTPPNSHLQVGLGNGRKVSMRGTPPATPNHGVSGRRPLPSPKASPRPSPKTSPKSTLNAGCRKRPITLVEGPDDRDEPRGATARFSDEQIAQLTQFVAEQGEGRVRGIMNTPLGIPREEYESLATKLQMDFHRVQSKLKRMVNPNKTKKYRPNETSVLQQDTNGTDCGHESPTTSKLDEEVTAVETMSPVQSSDADDAMVDAQTSESELDDEVQGMVELCRRGDVAKIEEGLNGVLRTIEQFKDGKKIARIAQLLVKKVQHPEEFTEEQSREMSNLLEFAKTALAESRQDRNGPVME